jgi:hypothetical protein
MFQIKLPFGSSKGDEQPPRDITPTTGILHILIVFFSLEFLYTGECHY